MIVVADTSPLRYLILIDEVDLLPQIFGEVVISDAVLSELLHENSPEAIKFCFRSAGVDKIGAFGQTDRNRAECLS